MVGAGGGGWLGKWDVGDVISVIRKFIARGPVLKRQVIVWTGSPKGGPDGYKRLPRCRQTSGNASSTHGEMVDQEDSILAIKHPLGPGGVKRVSVDRVGCRIMNKYH